MWIWTLDPFARTGKAAGEKRRECQVTRQADSKSKPSRSVRKIREGTFSLPQCKVISTGSVSVTEIPLERSVCRKIYINKIKIPKRNGHEEKVRETIGKCRKRTRVRISRAIATGTRTVRPWNSKMASYSVESSSLAKRGRGLCDLWAGRRWEKRTRRRGRSRSGPF